MRLWTVQEMRAVEEEAHANGISYDQMIEEAGQGVADTLDELYGNEEQVSCVVGLVGGGRNGSDTLSALIELAEKGWEARAYLLRDLPTDDVWKRRAADADIEMMVMAEDAGFEALEEWLEDADVLLDGLIGTGARLPLRDDVAQLLEKVFLLSEDVLIVAVDCPSGMDCETGEVSDVMLDAEMTICIHAVKAGQLKLPAFEYLGLLEVVPLTLPNNLTSVPKVDRRVATRFDAFCALPERPADSHKGMFGNALIAAGSIQYTGAAQLAALAAIRIGTGLVRLAVPGPLHLALASSIPEVTWLMLPHEMGVISAGAEEVLLKNFEGVDALLLGPGWGREETTGEFLRRLLSGGEHLQRRGIGFVAERETSHEAKTVLPPLVIDADGLRLLAKLPNWSDLLPEGTILTPHPGEMAALTGWTVDQIQADRIEAALHFAALWKQVVVLKGAFTVVASPDGKITVIPVATAALAHPGTGDVLSGILVGLRAQGGEAYAVAVAGAWFHANAGVAAEKRFASPIPVAARDIINMLPEVLPQRF